MSDSRLTLDTVAPRHRTTTTATYVLLVALGWLGLLTLLIGVASLFWAMGRAEPTVLQEIEAVLQCGLGALLAAVAFGVAELAWDVRNRLPERQNLFSQRDT